MIKFKYYSLSSLLFCDTITLEGYVDKCIVYIKLYSRKYHHNYLITKIPAVFSMELTPSSPMEGEMSQDYRDNMNRN